MRAFDGEEYGAWVSFTARTTAHAATPPGNRPPVVSASNITATHDQSFTGTQLGVTATDPDGDAITKYEFYDDGRTAGTADDNTDPSAGYFFFNGQQESEGQGFEVTVTDLANLTFQTASGTNLIWVRAYDGFTYGAWVSFTITAPVDHGPVVTVAPKTTIGKNTSLSMSGFVSATDADGDALTTYQFFDNTADPTSGHFVINGVEQPSLTNITVNASQLASISFVAGPGVGGVGSSDDLFVRAADSVGVPGQPGVYGAWQEFHINAPNQAPVVTGLGNVNLGGKTTSVALSTMFAASDPDGDPIVAYQLWDSTTDPNSGHFDVNGVVGGTQQNINVSPADFANTFFVEGTDATTKTVWMRANDGTVWGAWTSITVTEPADAPPPNNSPPTVTVSNITATTGQSFAAASLFTATDPDGDTITAYQFWDAGGDTAPLDTNGHFVLNGETLGEQQTLQVSSSQLNSLTFDAGSGSALEWVRAFDGFQWSAWQSFNVVAPVDSGPPTLNAPNPSLAENQSVSLASLVSGSDHAGASIQTYEFWQQQTSTGSHLVVDGTPAVGYRQNIDIAASQLSQASFVTGSSTGTDQVWVRANDGVQWSDWQSFYVTTHA